MSRVSEKLRRSLVALGEALHPRRWIVLGLAVRTELAVLGFLSLARGDDAALGIAVSFLALTAVAAGTLAGPLIGSLAALGGGAIFFATVAISAPMHHCSPLRSRPRFGCSRP